MEVTAALERFWPGRTTRCEPLTGGFTNHNFRVDVDGGSYVLRIGGNGPR
jgi:Ser/Thr protein kinase RdoA (MazF antagonist)